MLARPAAAGDPPADRASAERLFDEGRKLLEDGKLDEACAKLEASQRLDSAVGTLLNLGECNERRSRFATSWANYRAAASLALTRGDAARADFARKRSEQLNAKLSTLTIVTVAEPGLAVTRDGVTVDEAAWGTALPVDPGAHLVEAQAPGKKRWSRTVSVGEGASTVYVKIDPLVADSGGELPGSRGPGRTGQALPETLPPADGTRTTVRTLGFVGLAAGVVAIGAGTYFALRANVLWNGAEPHCDSQRRCDDYGFDTTHDARTNGNLATVTITAGIVFAAAGALALLLAPRAVSSTTPPPVSRRPGFTADGVGLVF